MDKELRKLVDHARSCKNDLLKQENRDLQPRAFGFRDGELLVSIFLAGDRDDVLRILRCAIGGYGLNELHLIQDTYHRNVSSEQYEKERAARAGGDTPRGEYERMFKSPDPVKQSLDVASHIHCQMTNMIVTLARELQPGIADHAIPNLVTAIEEKHKAAHKAGCACGIDHD